MLYEHGNRLQLVILSLMYDKVYIHTMNNNSAVKFVGGPLKCDPNKGLQTPCLSVTCEKWAGVWNDRLSALIFSLQTFIYYTFLFYWGKILMQQWKRFSKYKAIFNYPHIVSSLQTVDKVTQSPYHGFYQTIFRNVMMH